MKKLSMILLVIIIILAIVLGFMTYYKIYWKNSWKDAVKDIMKINGALEKAGVMVLYSRSGDSKVVLRQENNVITEEEYGQPLPY